MDTFHEIEKQKADVVSLIGGWPPARIVFRPSAEGWSAVEVIDHVVKTESAILAAAGRGLERPHPIGVRDRLGFLFLDLLFRSKFRVKVPASVPEILPGPGVTLADVVERWDAVRTDLAQMLKGMTYDQLRAGIFLHPVSGWMSMQHVLRFFSVHIRHHGYQIARIGEGR